jgi:CRISPR-associated endonuclease/helicase Cas3
MAIFKKGVELPPLQFDPTWVEKYKKRAISIKYPLDEVREQIYRKVTNLPAEELEEGEIFLMELPTGAGKTLALIKLALSLRKEKIFYLLPFITLIEQNAQIFREVLKEGGVDVEDNRYFFEKHSLSGGFQTKEEEYDLEKREFIGDNFNSRVIVTTFHQFFYSFFKSRNSLLKRAINVQNSVVVIDEIQAVKEDLFPLIESLLQFLVKRFNCKVIIATATLPPLQFDPSIKVVKLPKVDEILSSPQLAHFNRYEMDFSLPLLDENSILKLVEDKLKEGRDQLFRVNTINSANYLAKKIEGAVLLTSAIPPILRRRRIAQIKKEGGVVVATQVIQAGVDVSLKDGFEELAPLDLLVQSMGRRNRSGEKGKGFANVIRFNFKGFDGSRVYNQGLIKRTLRVVDQVGKVEEKEVHSLLDLYYRSMGREVSLLEKMENYMFKTLDRKFNLFEDSITLSFFTVLDEKSEELWEKLAELEERRQNLSLGRNFWQEKRQIEEEFDRIKKEVFLYTCNVRLFNPREDIAKVESYFDKALFLYRVDEEFFDPLTGVNIRQFLKEEDITW